MEGKTGRESGHSLIHFSFQNSSPLVSSLLHQFDEFVSNDFTEKGTLGSDEVGIRQRRLGCTAGIA